MSRFTRGSGRSLEGETFSRSVRREENGSHQREGSTDLAVVAIDGDPLKP